MERILAALKSLRIGKRNADDLTRMTARTLVYKLMVIAPAVLVLGIGVQSRTYLDPFDRDAAPPTEQQKINAYVPVVRDTTALLARAQIAPEELRSMAQRWVDGAASGELAHLTPVDWEDQWQDSPKGDAFAARLELAVRLSRTSQDVNADQPGVVVQDLLLSYRLLDVLKYSDLNSVFSASSQQRSVLNQARDWLEKVPADRRESLAASVRALATNLQPLEPLARRARSQYISYSRQLGENPLPIDDAKMFVLANEGEGMATFRSVALMADRGDTTVYSIGILASTAESHLKRTLDQISR